MKVNYFIIPIVVFLFSLTGSLITNNNLNWYETISIPEWTPSGAIIGMVWTVIFILSTISIILVWNSFKRGSGFNLIMSLFVLNGVLNVLWSWLFFQKHLLLLAGIEAVLLALTVLALIILIRPKIRVAAILLFPYLIWVTFASYLTFTVWNLNLKLI